MLSTPKPARFSRPSLGEPVRAISRQRDQSPGAKSSDSFEDVSASRGRPAHGREVGGSVMGAAPPRHSIARGITASHRSRDPRPIGDKGYATQCARNVIECLADRGFNRTIAFDKFLREPITKEVFEIFKFLIQQLDPLFSIEGKMEDELPQIMRRLKYPTEVNRSKLQAISGPNTWPQLLAVLDWLVTLIQVNESLIQPIARGEMGLASSIDADTEEGDHMLLRKLQENYSKFLNSRGDDEIEADEQALQQIYDERIQASRDEIQRLQDQHGSMQDNLHECRAQHDHLQELQNAPEHLDNEAVELRGFLQAQEARVQRIEEEVSAVESDEVKVQAEIEKLDLHARRLQEQVEGQAYSKTDIERLKCERSHLRKMYEDLRTETERAEANIFELQIQESRCEEAIGRTSRSVNDVAERVEKLVSNAGGPCGQELFVRIDLSEPTDVIAAKDFGEVSRRVQGSTASLVEEAHREEAGINEVLEEQRVAQEELSQNEQQLNHLKVRLEQVKRMREERRVCLATQLNDARQTAEETEDSVRQQSVSTMAPTLRDAQELDELHLRISEQKTAYARETGQLEQQLRRAQELSVDLRQMVTRELGLARDALDKVYDEAEKSVAEMAEGDQVSAPGAEPRPRSARTVAQGGC